MAISAAQPLHNAPPGAKRVALPHLSLNNDPRTETETRYERKFAIYDLDLQQIEMILVLNPASFTPIYKPRYINNIYLDTPQRDSYRHTVANTTPRMKVRIRWYGEMKGSIENPMLEFKIKEGCTGYKITVPLAAFTLGDQFTDDDLDRLIKRSSIPGDIRQKLISLEPSLLNRYHRSYYLSGTKKVRTTVDTDLTFHDIFSTSSPFQDGTSRDCVTVVESKYAPQDHKEAQAIASVFPFKPSNFSKYVAGVQQIYG